jgi:hypothetical protein
VADKDATRFFERFLFVPGAKETDDPVAQI